jgi:hypothetical protein
MKSKLDIGLECLYAAMTVEYGNGPQQMRALLDSAAMIVAAMQEKGGLIEPTQDERRYAALRSMVVWIRDPRDEEQRMLAEFVSGDQLDKVIDEWLSFHSTT